MYKNTLISCLLTCTLFSCDEIYVNKNTHLSTTNKVGLERVGSITFDLDSLSIPNTNCLQLYTDKRRKRFFTFLNSFSNTIYIYDFEDKSLVSTVTYHIEGDNGVGKIMGYYIDSFDSIFVYCYEASTLSITNSYSQILSKISIGRKVNNQPKYAPTPKLINGMPLIKTRNLVVLVGNLGGEYQDEDELNRPVQCFINIETGRFHFEGPYPEIYRQGNWGGQLYRYAYQAYNPGNNKIVLSFPADHNIQVLNLADKTRTPHYASIKQIGDIYSYSSRKYFLHDKIDLHRHYSTNPAYQTIYFDEYRNIYLRFFNLPVHDYDIAVKEKRTKTFGVVILDEHFKVIGYHIFPKFSHSSTEVFFAREGIFIRNYHEDENKMVFSQYNLTKYN